MLKKEKSDREKQLKSSSWLSVENDLQAKQTELSQDQEKATAPLSPKEEKEDSLGGKDPFILKLNGPRPGKEEENGDDAPPTKPGRSEYLSQQSHDQLANNNDSPDFDDYSMTSSIATVNSMTMNESVASSVRSTRTTSSVKTAKMSNTQKAVLRNNRQLRIPATWGSTPSTPTRSNPRRSNKGLDEEEVTRNITLPPAMTSPIARISSQSSNSSSQIQKIDADEQQNAYIPPFMQSMSPRLSAIDDVRSEQSVYSMDSHRSEYSTTNISIGSHRSAYSTTNTSMGSRHSEKSASNISMSSHRSKRNKGEEVTVDPPDDLTRNESQSSKCTDAASARSSVMSNYTDATSASSARSSAMSSYNDEFPSYETDDLMERGQSVQEVKGSVPIPNDDDDNDEAEESDSEKQKSRLFLFIALGGVVLVISIILMILLIPGGNSTESQPLPWFISTSAPSSSVPVEEGDPTLAPSVSNQFFRPTTLVPSSFLQEFPETNGPPSSPPAIGIGAALLSALKGSKDNQNVGKSVSIGGPNGDLIAFVGDEMAGIAQYNAKENSWSIVSSLETVFSFPDSAQIVLAADGKKVMLTYDGKFEVHQYLDSVSQWVRIFVLDEEGGQEGADSVSVGALSGDGNTIALAHPSIGVQSYRYYEKKWNLFPIVTDIQDATLQVELSNDGNMLAILTEDSVKIKTLNAASDTWETYGVPISETKKATGISLSGDGKILAVTSRTETMIFSLKSDFGVEKIYRIDQGGSVISLDYEGNFLAMGSSPQNLRTIDYFNVVTLFQRHVNNEVHPGEYYEYLDEVTLVGTSVGASLSFLKSESLKSDGSGFLALGSPLDGRMMEGSVRLFQVQQI
jgi:hypothetical protein